MNEGAYVEAGDVLGTVTETEVVVHKIMVPYGVSGTILKIEEGSFTVTDTIAVVETEKGKWSLP